MANAYHEQLQIVKGVEKTPGDAYTQEQGLAVIDLLGIGLTGWTVDAEWYPNRPALKGGGIWQDSNAATGSVLLDAYDGNVIENLTLDLSASDGGELATRLSVMEKMIRDARLFWSSDWQIEPVYLRWWAKGAKGPQFALIYDIEMDVQRNGTVEDFTRSVSLQITREPYWRWEVEPGGSPQKWSVFKNGGTWSSDTGNLPSSNLAKIYSSGVLANGGAVANYHRTTETASNVASVTCQGNFAVIPGADIPGDVPALLMLQLTTSGSGLWDYATGTDLGYRQKIWVGRKTNPSYNNLSGIEVIQRGTWPVDANDQNKFTCTMGTDTALVANTGSYAYSATCNTHTGQLATCTFANIADQARLSWRTSINAHRGRYAVFLRGFQTGGKAGDVSMYLKYGYFNALESRTPTINPPIRALANPQRIVDIIYMGEMILPPVARAAISYNQFGLQQETLNLRVDLFASATSTTPNLNVFDLVMIPIDEGAAIINFEKFAVAQDTLYTLNEPVFYDNTGYLSHGRPEDIAVELDNTTSADIEKSAEFVGEGLFLEPGVDNRLYFMWSDYQAGVSPVLGTTFIVPNLDPTNLTWANVGLGIAAYIVPRSIGARDD